MEKFFDGIVVLGARIGVNEKGQMAPGLQLEMRIRAAVIAYCKNIARKFILTGGHNIGVRYPLLLSELSFGDPSSIRKPDYSKVARISAKHYRSEASIMAEMMQAYYGIPPEALILEECSRTTQENAFFCQQIISRHVWKKIGLVTHCYHMDRAMREFQGVGLKNIEPVYTEDLLVLKDTQWINVICECYNVLRDGKRWDTKKIRELLIGGRSIGESIPLED